jgi:5-methylcytosine-specific restriction enzyme A
MRGIAVTFGFAVSQVKSQLDKLETDGVLVSTFIGNIRRFIINPRLAIKKELIAILEKMLSLMDEETTERYYRQRRRPAYSTKRRKHKEKRKMLWDRDHGICVICTEFDPNWEMDHTVPLAEGGSDDLSNLRTLCKKCHKVQTKRLNARLRQFHI